MKNCSCPPNSNNPSYWIGSLIGQLTIPVATKEKVEGDYEGDYEVTPKPFEDQILPTYGKKLANDIVIHKIPYQETSNSANGLTVYIAKESA